LKIPLFSGFSSVGLACQAGLMEASSIA